MADLSTPEKAREHARAMAGTVIANMPTVPASAAKNLPEGLEPSAVVWDESIGGGEYCARVIKRGTRVRLTNLLGDGCVSLLLLNADHPVERMNVADTVKIQWNAYLSKGKFILSDMGRVMMSIVEENGGRYDTFAGPSNEKLNAKKFGTGANYSPFPNARDRFVIALTKFGLGKKDIPPTVNLFKQVKIGANGEMKLVGSYSGDQEFVELRSEMNVLMVVANTPHVLDERKDYICTPVKVLGWRGEMTAADDWVRNSTPEALRAFQNTEDYYNV